MGRTPFDWRWIVVIIVALIFLGQIRLAPPVQIVLLGLGGYWALLAGLRPWRERRAFLGSTKVTYWRGQRIELPVGGSRGRGSRFRVPDTTALLMSILYLACGVGCVYAALRLAYLVFIR